MFVYDDDSRLYWFNRSSLENEREFELIGIILGAAIYNGVILDARFPHVVYKKLMGQPVGLADLKRNRPQRLASRARLLVASRSHSPCVRARSRVDTQVPSRRSRMASSSCSTSTRPR